MAKKKATTKKKTTAKKAAKKAAAKKAAAKQQTPKSETPKVDTTEEVTSKPGPDATDPAAAVPPKQDDEPKRSRSEGGQYTGDDKSTQPDEAYTPAKPRKLSEQLRAFTKVSLEAYFGKGGVDDKMESKVSKALENGHQVLVVPGKGNERFAVKISKKNVFDRDKPSDDVTEGVLLNLSRAACDAKLYPTR